VSIDNYISDPLILKTGDPQGSILGPILFSIYIELCVGLETVKVHFYANDTIIYSIASSIKVAMESLQKAFNSFQISLDNLKLAMNNKKNMIFTCCRLLSLNYFILKLLCLKGLHPINILESGWMINLHLILILIIF